MNEGLSPRAGGPRRVEGSGVFGRADPAVQDPGQVGVVVGLGGAARVVPDHLVPVLALGDHECLVRWAQDGDEFLSRLAFDYSEARRELGQPAHPDSGIELVRNVCRARRASLAEQWGQATENSSPPWRETMSLSRSVSRSTRAKWRRAGLLPGHTPLWPGHDEVMDRVRLGTWPTPLERAPRLAAHLGLRPDDLFVKRDDLTGLGAGGNKVRKLEYLCGSARERNATVLVTSGAAQSNHARLTAAAACRLGLRCCLVLAGEPPAVPRGNVALDGLLGADVVWSGSTDDVELVQRTTEVADEFSESGEVVELIPYGGSSVRGAYGYVDCGRELLDQLPDLRHVVIAVGSGGTMAGLVACLGPDRVLGVDAGAVTDPVERVAALVQGLGSPAATPGHTPTTLRVRTDQVGPGYGVLTPAGRDALVAAARCEGLVLDPVYTAKALSGLAAAVADGEIAPGEPVVFVHTGGLPGLFGHDVLEDPELFGTRAPR
jgi:L-cysteate sulfo-lyase